MAQRVATGPARRRHGLLPPWSRLRACRPTFNVKAIGGERVFAQARFPHPDGPSGEGPIRRASIQQVKEDRPMAKLPRPPHHLVENRHAASPADPGEHDGKLHPLVIGLDTAPPHQGAVEEDGAHAATWPGVNSQLVRHPVAHPGHIEKRVRDQVLSQRLVVEPRQKILCPDSRKGAEHHGGLSHCPKRHPSRGCHPCVWLTRRHRPPVPGPDRRRDSRRYPLAACPPPRDRQRPPHRG